MRAINKMRTIKLHLDNGATISRRVNLRIPECVREFLDKTIDGATCRCIEFLDMNTANYGGKHKRMVRRVYSVSEDFMRRHDLNCKFRCTENIYENEEWRFSPEPIAEYSTDHAYLLDYNMFCCP